MPATEPQADVKPAPPPTNEAEGAAVRRWVSRYNKAKARWEKDFTRMKENMEFASGIQWEGQLSIRDHEQRYVNNLSLRALQNKVSQLYARNPTVEAVPRKRLRYSLWDGTVEMLQQAMQGIANSQMQGVPDMMSLAIMMDFMKGKQDERLVKRICRTLEIVDQFDIDTQKPDYKEQMKQLVRRVVTCGVGYVRPNFVREGTPGLSTTEARHSLVDRAKMASLILDKIKEEKIQEQDAEMETLRSLLLSMGVSAQSGDEYELPERIEHDFLPATSVIPDERCRCLREFVAARWVFIEYHLAADEINSMFELEGDDQVKLTDSSILESSDNPGKQIAPEAQDAADPARSGKVTLIETLDITTKCRNFIVRGHKKYIQEPEPLYPCVSGFWPLQALTFNDCEVEEETKTSIFPPSDIDLIRDPQKEWNRTRNSLRAQRNANSPKYVTRKGALTQDDKNSLKNAEENEVIELEGVPADKTPADMVQVFQVARIDPAVYDTKPLELDVQVAAGVQQANVGPAQPDVTATVGSIAEQSRMTSVASNVDDLDGLLSRLARMRGELRMQGMSEQTVAHVVGPGYAWPTLTMPEYMNQLELTIKAASSGRPNTALHIANFERLAPFFQAAGANPVAMIEYMVRVLNDESIDPQDFFPVPGQFMPPVPAGVGAGSPPMNTQNPARPGNPQQGQQQLMRPQQPLQSLPSGAASVPLAAG